MPADFDKGDWQCPNPDCFNNQKFPEAFVYGNNPNCKKCGTGKTAKKPGDWCCPNPHCVNAKNTVYGSKVTCPKCGAPKPGSMQGLAGFYVGNAMPSVAPNAGRQGDWHCPNPECKNHVDNVCYGSKSHCSLCGTPKPAQPPMPSARMGRMPIAGMAVTPYGLPMPQRQLPVQRNPSSRGGQAGDWNCPNPNCKNHIHNFVYGSKPNCPICGAPNPEQPGFGGQPGFGHGGGRSGIPAARPGDWNCPNAGCKNHTDNFVYASKSHCPLCATPKPDDIGRGRSRSPHNGGGVPVEFEEEEYVDVPADDAVQMPYVDGFARFQAYGRAR